MSPTSPSRQVSICLLSGHAIVLQELQRVLSDGSFAVFSMKIGENLKAAAAGKLPEASVYVIDGESVPGGAKAAIEYVAKESPNGQLLVLADKLSEETVFPLLNVGVRGLITHDMIEQQLARALDAVANGGYWVPRTLLASFVDSVVSRTRKAESSRPTAVEISRREKDIVEGLLQNLSNKEIANRLNISERTVKFHVSNLLTKFKVQRRADLILLWYQQGIGLGEDSKTLHATTRRVQ